MDLTQIRAKIIALSGIRDVFTVDDAINQAQRQYIQPIAKLPGLANIVAPGQRTVVGEDNALDVTNTIYTTTYKPLLPGSVQVLVGGTLREDDATGYTYTIDYENGTVTFDAAQTDAVTVNYTTENSIKLTDIAADIYLLSAVKWVNGGNRYAEIPLLPAEDSISAGLRRYNDRVYLQGYPGEMHLAVQYWRLLSDFGTATGQITTPQIAALWHDLYWVGALAVLNPTGYMALFLNRLEAYEREQHRTFNPPGARMKPMRW
jgi:hypothetical protein